MRAIAWRRAGAFGPVLPEDELQRKPIPRLTIPDTLSEPMERAFYSSDVVEALADRARSARLTSLEAELAKRMTVVSTVGEFFARSRELVEELRALGYDLWSFDSDGHEFETWCGDWTREGGTPLVLSFRYPRTVKVEWSMRPTAR